MGSSAIDETKRRIARGRRGWFCSPLDLASILLFCWNFFCDEIFCRELEGWYTDEDVRPKDRSLKVFKQWFDVQHYEVVEDVGRGPIENDEGLDEKHRFDPSPPPRRSPPKKKPRA